MAVFAYQGTNSQGDLETGQVEAESHQAALELLRRRRVYPAEVQLTRPPSQPAAAATSAEPRPERRSPRPPAPGLKALGVRASAATRAAFWRQGAQMQAGGISLPRTLELWSGGRPTALSRFAAAAIPRVREGTPLSALMRERPELFGPFEVAMVQAGEASGRLDYHLERLAVHFENLVRLAQSVRGQLAYAGCVGTVFLIVAFIVGVVAPAIATARSGGTANVAAGAVQFFAPLLILPLAWFGLRAAYVSNAGLRLAVDRGKLLVPVAGTVVRKLALARYFESLSHLIAAGVPVSEANEVSAATTGNLHLAERFYALSPALRQGVPLSMALAATREVAPQAVQMIVTGEESGTTDEMLAKLSSYYEGEAAAATSQLAVFGTVALMLVLALAVGVFAIRFFMNLYGPVLDELTK